MLHKYILELTSTESYSLNLDVNACIGLYEQFNKGSISFQPMACTKICCDSAFAVELSGLFPKMTGYYTRGSKLYFEGDGEIILHPF